MQKIISRVKSRRGVESALQAKVFDPGELVVTTDTGRLAVGDGVTLGGVNLTPKITSVTDLAASKNVIFENDIILYQNQLYRSDVSGYLESNISLSDFTPLSSQPDGVSLEWNISTHRLHIKAQGVSPVHINSTLIGNGLQKSTAESAISVNADPTYFIFNGSGVLQLTGASASPVRYDAPQGLNTTQQTQARANINALAVNGDGTQLTGLAKLASTNTFSGTNNFQNTTTFDGGVTSNGTTQFTGSVNRTSAVPVNDKSGELISSNFIALRNATFLLKMPSVLVPGLDSGDNFIDVYVSSDYNGTIISGINQADIMAYFVVGGLPDGIILTEVEVILGSVRLRFYNYSGLDIDINGRYVVISRVGLAV